MQYDRNVCFLSPGCGILDPHGNSGYVGPIPIWMIPITQLQHTPLYLSFFVRKILTE